MISTRATFYAIHPSQRERVTVELKIAEKVIKTLLAAGYEIAVHNGGEFAQVDRTDNADAILAGMWLTDEDYLAVQMKDSTNRSFVDLIYGNGADLISDHGVYLEKVLEPVLEWVETEGFKTVPLTFREEG